MLTGFHNAPNLIAGGGRNRDKDLLDICLLDNHGQALKIPQYAYPMDRSSLFTRIVVNEANHMIIQGGVIHNLPQYFFSGLTGADDQDLIFSGTQGILIVCCIETQGIKRADGHAETARQNECNNTVSDKNGA